MQTTVASYLSPVSRRRCSLVLFYNVSSSCAAHRMVTVCYSQQSVAVGFSSSTFWGYGMQTLCSSIIHIGGPACAHLSKRTNERHAVRWDALMMLSRFGYYLPLLLVIFIMLTAFKHEERHFRNPFNPYPIYGRDKQVGYFGACRSGLNRKPILLCSVDFEMFYIICERSELI